MEKHQGTGVTVDALFAKADQLLTTAEETQDSTGVYANCRAAVKSLLLAFLVVQGAEDELLTDLPLGQLWERCVAQDPEILPLAAKVGLFQEEQASITTADDLETVRDAANEVWDFIFDSCAE